MDGEKTVRSVRHRLPMHHPISKGGCGRFLESAPRIMPDPEQASAAFSHFQNLWSTYADLRNAAAVLEWDQLVNMPPGGSEARGEQLATLHRIAHEHLVSEAMADAITEAEASEGRPNPPETTAQAALRVARRDHDRARRVPTDLVSEMARVATAAYSAWEAARSEGRFALFAPHLSRLIELARERADALGHQGERYDALLADQEPGLRTSQLRTLFAEVDRGLQPLLQSIAERPEPGRPLFRRNIPEPEQVEAGRWAVTAFGFRWRDGRQDRSTHPFMISFAPSDVRMTTRLRADDFASGFFATLHECGHALYEQGIPDSYRRTPLAQVPSLGLHESQSRLWENCVGRSLPFWQYFQPQLARCSAAFCNASPEDLWRACNRVDRSLIRVEADEVTYHLHISLRLELELALLSGDLPVAALPEAWNEASVRYLGLRPANDREGVLQDVHWSGGGFAAFPSYSLGNILAGIWMEAAESRVGNLDQQIAAGDFRSLLQFLRQEIHSRGGWDTTEELVERVRGGPLTPEPYLRRLRAKFSELYGL